MSDIVVIAPAPPSLLLEAGGQFPTLRRAMLLQAMIAESAAITDRAGALLAVFFVQRRPGRRYAELAAAIRPPAARHMRTLVRLAQLTLRRLTETGVVVFCRVRPDNRAGQRMAHMAGFRRLTPHGRIWTRGR